MRHEGSATVMLAIQSTACLQRAAETRERSAPVFLPVVEPIQPMQAAAAAPTPLTSATYSFPFNRLNADAATINTFELKTHLRNDIADS